MVGYNKKKGPVVRMEPYLKKLWTTRETIEWVAERPDSLAYKLREAMYAAKYHEGFRHYHDLSFIYKIRPGERSVTAEYIGKEKDISLAKEDVAEAVERTPTALRVEDATDLESVMGAGIKFAATNKELHFPNADLNESDLNRLWTWTSLKGWQIILHGEGAGLTITRNRVDDEITWRPDNTIQGEHPLRRRVPSQEGTHL